MNGRRLGRIQKNAWLADNTSWSSRPNKIAHYDEYSDDGDDSDKIYESDYMDNAYDEQVYIDNNGYHERFECHSHYPVKCAQPFNFLSRSRKF
ncbi:Angiotensin-converting enzyme [Dirofilaria immitis]